MYLHHVQVACPRGGENAARAFYGQALGMTEVDKPEALAKRGGCWFRAFDAAGALTAEVHVGVEESFGPAKKAHPAFVFASVEELEAKVKNIEAGGFTVDWQERYSFPGFERCHSFDGAGNRIELLSPLSS